MIMQHCGHLERTRSAPRGRTAADGADIPPGHSTGLDLYQARKRGALGLVQGARLFPFRGGSLGPPPPFFRAWLSGVLGPPPCFLGWGLRLGIWLRARVDHDDVEAFGTAFLGVPTAVQLILHDLGFAPVQSDGEVLVACCLEWVKKDQVANPDAGVFDPRPWTRIVGIAPDGNHVLVASDTYNLILARILGSQPQPLEEADLELAAKTLQQLLFRAAGARQSHTYSPLEMEQAIRDREEWILSGSIEAPDVLAVANKWRHWKPGKIQTQLPTSQRALEQHLRARWLERLLGYFIPFRHQIPYMHQVMGAKELEEFGHLFGDARFRTIRAHCLAYEGMRKIGFQNLPWTAGDVRHLMNQAVTLEVTPAKLQKWWGTLKWLSIKLGMLNVDEHKQLLAKRKAIQETLVDTQVKPQRKAVVPTRAIVWALEQGGRGPLGEPGPGIDQSSRQVHYGDGQVQPSLQRALQRRASHLAADGQVHEQHPGAARLADKDHVGSGHQTEPGPAHRPIILFLGGQMVDPLGKVVEEIQGLGGVP